jgi:hypothetical protein
MFVLAPSTRFGYFIYPAAMVLWLLVSQAGRRSADQPDPALLADESDLLSGPRDRAMFAADPNRDMFAGGSDRDIFAGDSGREKFAGDSGREKFAAKPDLDILADDPDPG